MNTVQANKDNNLLQQIVPPNVNFKVKLIPPGHLVISDTDEFNIWSRENFLKLPALTHYQFTAEIFKPLIRQEADDDDDDNNNNNNNNIIIIIIIIILDNVGFIRKDVVVITEDVQNVHLLLEYRPHIDVSLTCEHDPKLQEYCVCPQKVPQFDSEGIPNQAPDSRMRNIDLQRYPTCADRRSHAHSLQNLLLYSGVVDLGRPLPKLHTRTDGNGDVQMSSDLDIVAVGTSPGTNDEPAQHCRPPYRT
ncbi:hypothetical protein ANN_03609 [Periplaneta americana]|uniref:Uncharacterized protein n=1 Tax=Periplaneta americana TaxID=6978 RepID=A0ABQ8U0M5_PERAM|nr:hypothetical protein ANN_03609 [Periplaneta americana]